MNPTRCGSQTFPCHFADSNFRILVLVVQDTRKIQMTYVSGVVVTPMTQAGVDYLNQADNCPCSTATPPTFWTVGQAATLTCDTVNTG